MHNSKDLRDTLKAKHPEYSFINLWTKVLLPEPDGPLKTKGCSELILCTVATPLDSNLLKATTLLYGHNRPVGPDILLCRHRIHPTHYNQHASFQFFTPDWARYIKRQSLRQSEHIQPFAEVTDTAHVQQGYETVECPSICLSHRMTAGAAGCCWVPCGKEILIDSRRWRSVAMAPQHGTWQQWHMAASAGSVMLTVNLTRLNTDLL